MMTIFSESNRYTVLARLRGNRRRLVATCKNGEWHLLVMIDNRREARRLTPLLMDINKNESFTDFIEVFPYRNGICAVFKHCEGTQMRCLEEVIGQAPQKMRAVLLRSLFAKLFAQDIPALIVTDVLCTENLLVSPSGELAFVYDLDFIENNDASYADRARAKAMLQLSGIVQQISHGVTLEAFWVLSRRLVCDNGETWSRLYEAAKDAADALNLYVPENPPALPTLRERILQWRDTVLKSLEALLPIVLIAAGYVLFMILFYRIVVNPAPVDNGIAEIGTVILPVGGE